jgi:hypothetical protein
MEVIMAVVAAAMVIILDLHYQHQLGQAGAVQFVLYGPEIQDNSHQLVWHLHK